MKRSPMPRRRTPIQRRTEIDRRSANARYWSRRQARAERSLRETSERPEPKPRRRSRGFSQATRRRVLVRDDWTCQAHARGFATDIQCGGILHVHHVILKSQGGPDTVDNGLTVCTVHHTLAHDVDRAGAESTGIIRRAFQDPNHQP